MSLDPPLPVYLFNVVSGLRDKSAKGYPVKKVHLLAHLMRASSKIVLQLLLVLWKTILTCCGGIREIARAKKLARELANLPTVPDEGWPFKYINTTYSNLPTIISISHEHQIIPTRHRSLPPRNLRQIPHILRNTATLRTCPTLRRPKNPSETSSPNIQTRTSLLTHPCPASLPPR